jgi:iodotyrosine deiodinase
MATVAGPYSPVPLRFERLTEPEALQRSLAFLERLLERRSVRQFSAEPVPRELIENAVRLLAARLLARTSSRGRSSSSPIP